MKRESFLDRFMKRFIRVLLMTVLLGIVGIGSYKLTIFYYNEVQINKKVKSEGIMKGVLHEGQADDISKNLIYCVDQESGEITQFVVEIFNTITNNLDYITIPAYTQYTMSNDMYREICETNIEVPQIVKLSELNKYFDKNTIYGYGVMLVEDLLDIDISYYTAINADTYASAFTDDPRTIVFDKSIEDNQEDRVSETVNVQILREEFLSNTGLNQGNKKIEKIIKESYEVIESNLTLKNKLKYLENYEKVQADKIYYHSVYGEMSGDYFIVSLEKSQGLVKEVVTNETYTIAQKEVKDSEKMEDSKACNIEILNGCGIEGLALTYKSLLQEEGYKVVGIGNSKEEILEVTQILVKNDSIGEDLLKFFSEAKIQKADLQEGVDIQIIVGKEDSIK
jgi:hypothetical protein